ncbi:hypothetical protein F5H01DRAFT_340593 [Linnemannia elongata]|nr:hypothetical protein F5H01DRAFT_340593 [Linnemannia elongata]
MFVFARNLLGGIFCFFSFLPHSLTHTYSPLLFLSLHSSFIHISIFPFSHSRSSHPPRHRLNTHPSQPTYTLFRITTRVALSLSEKRTMDAVAFTRLTETLVLAQK